MRPAFEVLIGRIETLDLDAVVNAANRALRPGSGVDGALRVAAGPELTRHTSGLPSIGVGEAVITPGYGLPARFIIHTAAPIFSAAGEPQALAEGLARCYASALSLAQQNDLRDIAFPCLGTGVYGWPRETACEIALEACRQAAPGSLGLKRIIFCCFTDADAAPYLARIAD